MRWIISLFSLFCTVLYGQIPHEVQSPFPKDEFMIYYSFEDSLSKTLYQIGRHEPDGNFQHTHAPVYLKVLRNDLDKYYYLNDYSESSFYSIKELASENLLFITARYHFYIYDRNRGELSEKNIPGFEQYEGEDAISGLYDGLELFDNSQFLLGTVQGFGIFCFDISKPTSPKQLRQYGSEESANGGFYAFFVHKQDNLYDVIIAQHDVNYENVNIRNYYSKLKASRYVVRDEEFRHDSLGEPLVLQEDGNLIFETTNRSYCLDLDKGILSVMEQP